MRRQCVTCQHWQPTPPNDWEVPSYGGDFTVHSLRRYLYEHNWTAKHIQGTCKLTPEWRAATAFHGCASHASHPAFDMEWDEFTEIFEMRGRINKQHAEIKRLTLALKELRAKQRAERSKQRIPAEAAE